MSNFHPLFSLPNIRIASYFIEKNETIKRVLVQTPSTTFTFLQTLVPTFLHFCLILIKLSSSIKPFAPINTHLDSISFYVAGDIASAVWPFLCRFQFFSVYSSHSHQYFNILLFFLPSLKWRKTQDFLFNLLSLLTTAPIAPCSKTFWKYCL